MRARSKIQTAVGTRSDRTACSTSVGVVSTRGGTLVAAHSPETAGPQRTQAAAGRCGAETTCTREPRRECGLNRRPDTQPHGRRRLRRLVSLARSAVQRDASLCNFNVRGDVSPRLQARSSSSQQHAGARLAVTHTRSSSRRGSKGVSYSYRGRGAAQCRHGGGVGASGCTSRPWWDCSLDRLLCHAAGTAATPAGTATATAAATAATAAATLHRAHAERFVDAGQLQERSKRCHGLGSVVSNLHIHSLRQ
jgi:hypothetical protein